jgi:anthranilate phosphoribosyltransferase
MTTPAPSLKRIAPITPGSPAALHRTPRNLSDEMLYLFINHVGEMSPSMIAADHGLARERTIGEIAAAAQVMREFSIKVYGRHHQPARHRSARAATARTRNISAALQCFVAAAFKARARVKQHGGRSVSSSSGSADGLWALPQASTSICNPSRSPSPNKAQTGIGFMYA